MKKETNQMIEEWRACRKEMQDFNSHLIKLRIGGTLIFLAVALPSMTFLYFHFYYGQLISSALAMIIVACFWGIDRRMSKLMVAVSKRLQEIESNRNIKFKLSKNVHERWTKLSVIERSCDSILYFSLVVFGLFLMALALLGHIGLFSLY